MKDLLKSVLCCMYLRKLKVPSEFKRYSEAPEMFDFLADQLTEQRDALLNM